MSLLLRHVWASSVSLIAVESTGLMALLPSLELMACNNRMLGCSIYCLCIATFSYSARLRIAERDEARARDPHRIPSIVREGR